MGSWKGRGKQYIQLVKVLYCKLLTDGKQLPAFPLEAMPGTKPGLRGGMRECYHSATVASQLAYKKHMLKTWPNMTLGEKRILSDT